MKRVEAFLAPIHLDPLVDRLRMIGIPGMTLHDLRAVSSEPHEVTYRGVVGKTDLVPQMRLDIVVPDDQVPGILNAILLVVRRGDPADGTILVTPVEDAVRIRTGELGADAL